LKNIYPSIMEILKSTDGKESFILGTELYRQLEIEETYAGWISKTLNAEMENIHFWREYAGSFPKSKTEILSIGTAKDISLHADTERGLQVFRQLCRHTQKGKLNFVTGGVIAP
jgi:phage anti-repressor protein